MGREKEKKTFMIKFPINLIKKGPFFKAQYNHYGDRRDEME